MEWDTPKVHDQLPDHLLRVYRFAMHLCGDQHMAEDLAQEAMLRAIRNSDGPVEPQAIKVWLLRIVKNLWIDACRARGRHPNHVVPEVDIVVEWVSSWSKVLRRMLRE